MKKQLTADAGGEGGCDVTLKSSFLERFQLASYLTAQKLELGISKKMDCR